MRAEPVPPDTARSAPDAWLLRDVRIVPMDGPAECPIGAVRRTSIRIVDDRIEAIDPSLVQRAGERVVDCSGLTALPGFVQGHVHFCQTLFRGLADDRPLLDWLRERIWPLEAAHDAVSTRVSAELAVHALLRGGTTTVQTMESVRHAEQSFEVAATVGMTAIIGNCLMDSGDGAPQGFVTTADEALRIAESLHAQFHGRGRLQFAIAPRFILSCSDALSRQAAEFAAHHGLRIHTHAGEHPAEVAAVRAAHGTDYLLALDAQGLLGERTGLAHCVHLTAAERAVLRSSGSAVLHCPSANLKLGSGIAPIASYRADGIRVAIGADGAPCNNRLSALTELRQAALLQSVAAGPGVFTAAQALFCATRGGAEALGLEHELGSLVVGKRADLVLLDLDDVSLDPGGDVVGKIVYAAEDRHVRQVFVGGRRRVFDGRVVDFDHDRLRESARVAVENVQVRAGLRA